MSAATRAAAALIEAVDGRKEEDWLAGMVTGCRDRLDITLTEGVEVDLQRGPNKAGAGEAGPDKAERSEWPEHLAGIAV